MLFVRFLSRGTQSPSDFESYCNGLDVTSVTRIYSGTILYIEAQLEYIVKQNYPAKIYSVNVNLHVDDNNDKSCISESISL